jgi:xanthine dehydrogenase/oxidase
MTTETIIAHVASACGKACEEIRQVNMYTVHNAVTPYNQPIEHFTLPTLWTQLGGTSDFANRQGQALLFNKSNRWRKRGIAMSPVKYGVAWPPTAAIVTVAVDGTVNVTHAGADMGQGIHTRVTQVVAYALGCPMSCVNVNDTNTDVIPNMLPTGGSMGTGSNCQAVLLACRKLASRLQPVQLQLLQAGLKAKRGGSSSRSSSGSERTVHAEEAHQGRGRVQQGIKGWRYDTHAAPGNTNIALTTATPEAMLGGGDGDEPSWVDIVGTAYAEGVDLLAEATFTGGVGTGGERLLGLGGYHREHPKDYYNFGASVTEVEIDVLTGEVQVLRTDILYDCGVSLNPGLDIGQMEGARRAMPHSLPHSLHRIKQAMSE